MLLIGIIIGLVAGSIATLFLVSLLKSGSEADSRMEQIYKDAQRR